MATAGKNGQESQKYSDEEEQDEAEAEPRPPEPLEHSY